MSTLRRAGLLPVLATFLLTAATGSAGQPAVAQTLAPTDDDMPQWYKEAPEWARSDYQPDFKGCPAGVNRYLRAAGFSSSELLPKDFDMCSKWRTPAPRPKYKESLTPVVVNHASCAAFFDVLRTGPKPGTPKLVFGETLPSSLQIKDAIEPVLVNTTWPYTGGRQYRFWVYFPSPLGTSIKRHVHVWPGQTKAQEDYFLKHYKYYVLPHERGHEALLGHVLASFSGSFSIQANSAAVARMLAEKEQERRLALLEKIDYFVQISMYDSIVRDWGQQRIGGNRNHLPRFPTAEDEQNFCHGEPVYPEPADAVAVGAGDPHITTFDGTKYDLQGYGEYVLVDSPDVVLQARMVPYEPPDGPTSQIVSVISGFALEIYGTRFNLTRDGLGAIKVNGAPLAVTPGESVDVEGGLTLSRAVVRKPSNKSILGTEYSIAVTRAAQPMVRLIMYPRSSSVVVRVPLGTPTRGLLGTNDGVRSNDLTARSGVVVSLGSPLRDRYRIFGDSWRVTDADSMFEYQTGESTASFTNRQFPHAFADVGMLTKAQLEMAKTFCEAGGASLDGFMEGCLVDVGLTGEAAFAGEAEVAAQSARGPTVSVGAGSNIWAAGLASVPQSFGGNGGYGTLPVEIKLPPGDNRVFRVRSSAGEIDFNAGSYGPDGLGVSDDDETLEFLSPINSSRLSGAHMRRRFVLMGVFLAPGGQPDEPAPIFECGALNSLTYEPDIGSTFCIGDGYSDSQSQQSFFIPDGASSLFLGYFSRLTAGAKPGYWADDTGSWSVSYSTT